MKTFVILISVEHFTGPREMCNQIEGSELKINKEDDAFVFASDVRKAVHNMLELDDSRLIEVEPISDFMERVNDEMFNPDDYFMSYVYA